MCNSWTLLDERHNQLRLKILPDPEPLNPRRDHDNASVLACAHRRYDLGDRDGLALLRDAIRESRFYRGSCEDDARAGALDLSAGCDLATALSRCPDIVSRALYLYDHSGITIATSPFGDPWDSAQVGFAFMTRKSVLKEYGGKLLSPALRERALALIEAEVVTYDQYLTGDVWGFVVEDEQGDQLDSCWGYFGSEYAIEEGREAARRLGVSHVPLTQDVSA